MQFNKYTHHSTLILTILNDADHSRFSKKKKKLKRKPMRTCNEQIKQL